jgi:nucleoside 2-deoxyribosyltransferase
MKRVFIICTVRGATPEYQKELENYVELLESQGIKVHLPHRDTNQNDTGFNICNQNANAIRESDEVHIFYNPDSQGTHFDMGVAFSLKKKIVVVKNVEFGPGKSYPRMLHEWQEKIN